MLPTRAIERVFERLTLTYGRDFTARFQGLDANTVRSMWAHELASFGDDLESIAWALEHLPESPPNVIQFRNLCRHAPPIDAPRIEAPKADPERVREELARLTPMLAPNRDRANRPDRRAWAKTLIERHQAGAHRATPTALRMAHEALKTGD